MSKLDQNMRVVCCIYTYHHLSVRLYIRTYGVAATRRLLKNIGLFCKRDLLKRGYSAQETYNVKEPTNRITMTTYQCDCTYVHMTTYQCGCIYVHMIQYVCTYDSMCTPSISAIRRNIQITTY